MTEHLTRHDSEHDDDLTGRADAREPGTVPGQDHADFREPDTAEGWDGDFGGDQNLSTADLASASAKPAGEDSRADTTPAQSGGDVETPALIDEEKVTGFRDRWQNVQTGFVDDPKQAVQQADELVAGVISALATTFAEHKSELENQWQQGEPATEELRIALRRYRSFFDQLLPR
ncbi:hypothetical protein M8542_28365 [Amycolatopsis sp. OK19-0408]|uniref:Uncharacterized protein n=1 Tax=Amycolatopsis iheyensis TaxID=2945988 RepID=A0A9X2NFJ6_9PSEU|nr:hypothetical protein [Amycolatopsis iheyensis]MCR6486748.1 hypothetical protein [Amycolatopsis iheyensis]